MRYIPGRWFGGWSIQRYVPVRWNTPFVSASVRKLWIRIEFLAYHAHFLIIIIIRPFYFLRTWLSFVGLPQTFVGTNSEHILQHPCHFSSSKIFLHSPLLIESVESALKASWSTDMTLSDQSASISSVPCRLP